MEQLTAAFAFVLMPFESSFDDIYRFGIKEPARTLQILAQRVDEQIYQEGILERIYRQIEAADIVIADMTGRNANVFYEVGYAHAKDKLCILLTTRAEDIPFDLKHRRHIVYEGSIELLRTKLVDELKWALEEIQNVRDSHIKVSLSKASGELLKTKYQDEGELTLKIDLSNDSEETSRELEALYFYSTAGWTLYQDGKECASTDSDREIRKTTLHCTADSTTSEGNLGASYSCNKKDPGLCTKGRRTPRYVPDIASGCCSDCDCKWEFRL